MTGITQKANLISQGGRLVVVGGRGVSGSTETFVTILSTIRTTSALMSRSCFRMVARLEKLCKLRVAKDRDDIVILITKMYVRISKKCC